MTQRDRIAEPVRHRAHDQDDEPGGAGQRHDRIGDDPPDRRHGARHHRRGAPPDPRRRGRAAADENRDRGREQRRRGRPQRRVRQQPQREQAERAAPQRRGDDRRRAHVAGGAAADDRRDGRHQQQHDRDHRVSSTRWYSCTTAASITSASNRRDSAPAAGLAEPAALRRRVEERADRGDQRRDVLGRHEAAGLAIDDGVDEAGDARGDDRQAERAGFDGDGAETLAIAGQAEEIAGREVALGVEAEAHAMDRRVRVDGFEGGGGQGIAVRLERPHQQQREIRAASHGRRGTPRPAR